MSDKYDTSFCASHLAYENNQIFLSRAEMNLNSHRLHKKEAIVKSNTINPK